MTGEFRRHNHPSAFANDREQPGLFAVAVLSPELPTHTLLSLVLACMMTLQLLTYCCPHGLWSSMGLHVWMDLPWLAPLQTHRQQSYDRAFGIYIQRRKGAWLGRVGRDAASASRLGCCRPQRPQGV